MKYLLILLLIPTFLFAAVDDWWDANYTYRKIVSCNISHTQYDTVHFLHTTLDSHLVANSQADGDDIRVIFQIAANQYELGRYLTKTTMDTLTEVYFEVSNNQPGENIPANEDIGSQSDYKYYIYYGYAAASANYPTYANVVCIDAPYSVDGNTEVLLHFEETAGDYLDETANNNDTNTEDVTSRTASGKYGKCPEFTTTSSNYIDWGANTFNDLTTITLEAWVKIKTVSVNQGIFTIYYSGEDRWYLAEKNTHINVHNDIDNSTVTIEGATAMSNDIWYHFAAILNGSGHEIFLNGSSEDSDVGVDYFNQINSNAYSRLGAMYASGVWGYFLNGYIDEFRISTIARSNFYHIASEAVCDLGAFGSKGQTVWVTSSPCSTVSEGTWTKDDSVCVDGSGDAIVTAIHDTIYIYNFDLAVPADSTVDSIKIRYDAHSTVDNKDNVCRFRPLVSKTNGQSWCPTAGDQSAPTTTSEVSYYHCSTWGCSWTSTACDSIAVRIFTQGFASTGSNEGHIDYVAVSAYYSYVEPSAATSQKGLNVDDKLGAGKGLVD